MIAAPLILLVIALELAVLTLAIIAWWRVFEKAGKPGWAALVPIYNILVYLEIIGKPWWWIFMFMIPFANIVFLIWAYNMLSKSFGKSEGFTVGLVLVSLVFICILGFGSAKYQGPAGAISDFSSDRTN